MTPRVRSLAVLLLTLALVSCAHALTTARRSTLTGRVLDATGPAAGVPVRLTRGIADETFSQSRCPDPAIPWGAFFCLGGLGRPVALLDALAGRREAATVAVTVTDGAGQFRFVGLAPGAYAVWAHRGADEVADAYVPDLAGEERDVLLGLRTGLTVENTVVAEDGRPLSGVDVVAVHDWHTRYFRTRTDVAGRFRFEGLPDGDFTFVFAAEGHVPTSADVNTAYASGRPLILPALRTLTGRVTQNGRPVRGAHVSALGLPVVSTRTTADGRFHFEDVGPGYYELVAETSHASAVLQLRWDAGEPVPEVQFELLPGGKIEGAVRDPWGRPVEGVRFELSGGPMLGPIFGLFPPPTRADGHFASRVLPAGTYVLTAITPDGQRVSQTVRLGPGGARVPVTLPRSALVQVTVRDSAGEPVTGMPVTLVTPGVGTENLRADLDATGSARFHVAGRGKARLELSLTGAVEGLDVDEPLRGERRFELDVPSGPRVLVLENIPSRRLEGTVRTEQGVPLPGLAVTLHPREPGPWSEPTTSTDAAGRYVLRQVAPGPYVLELVRRQHGSLRRWTQPVAVTDAARQQVDVRMPRGTSLEVEVVDARGAPLVGAYVDVKEPTELLQLPPSEVMTYSFDGPLEGHVTDHRGRTVLRDLTLPEYDLEVDVDLLTQHDRLRDTRFHVEGGGTRVRAGQGRVRVVVDAVEDRAPPARPAPDASPGP